MAFVEIRPRNVNLFEVFVCKMHRLVLVTELTKLLGVNHHHHQYRYQADVALGQPQNLLHIAIHFLPSPRPLTASSFNWNLTFKNIRFPFLELVSIVYTEILIGNICYRTYTKENLNRI